MEYMFWNMVVNSGADLIICHLGWDRVWQSVVNYFRLSGQESLSMSWCLSRILNRSIQPSKGLRIDILEKEPSKYKGLQTLMSKAWMTKQVALTGVIQAQGEKRGAAEGKSDRSRGREGQKLTLGGWEPWGMDWHFLLRMWPQTSYFKFAAASLKWT